VIKAIVFDFDGVLTTDKTGSLTTNRYLSRMANVDYETVRTVFSKYNHDLLVGKITHREIWEPACKAMHHEIAFSLLERAFLSTPINHSMFALARRLKPNYALGIITDNKKDRMDCLRKAQALDALFDPIIVSAEFGSGKDSAAVFEYALHRLDAKPEECVFIDNNPENLTAPKALGMGVLFHDDEKNDVDRLALSLTNEYLIRLD
jgi:HAD superfamily hydrolase (TIGR01549 family)